MSTTLIPFFSEHKSLLSCLGGRVLGEAHGDHPPHDGEEAWPCLQFCSQPEPKPGLDQADTLPPGIAVAADVFRNYFSEAAVRMFHRRAALSTAEHSAALTLSVKLGFRSLGIS